MEYINAFERDIVTESLISDISKKVMGIIEFIGRLIREAIKFITQHIMKLRKIKKTDKDPTPNSQGEPAGAEVMQKRNPKVVYIEDLYDCGNELTSVVDDIEFCINLLAKRPKPDHKVSKKYDERWQQDNELIADRMTRSMGILEKLEGIDKKTLSEETGEKLNSRLEVLNATYDKYGRIYQSFIKQHADLEVYMRCTQSSFNIISSTAAKAVTMVKTMYTPA